MRIIQPSVLFSFSYLFVCQEQLLYTTNIHYSTNIQELEYSNHQILEFSTIHPLFTLYCKIKLHNQINVNFMSVAYQMDLMDYNGFNGHRNKLNS